MKDNFCQLWLTVGSRQEADKIAKALLDKHLVACVRQVPVSSDFWWQGKKQQSDEVLLQMESSMELFDEVEQEVTTLHQYDTFVLEATPVEKISKKAAAWLNGELKR